MTAHGKGNNQVVTLASLGYRIVSLCCDPGSNAMFILCAAGCEFLVASVPIEWESGGEGEGSWASADIGDTFTVLCDGVMEGGIAGDPVDLAVVTKDAWYVAFSGGDMIHTLDAGKTWSLMTLKNLFGPIDSISGDGADTIMIPTTVTRWIDVGECWHPRELEGTAIQVSLREEEQRAYMEVEKRTAGDPVARAQVERERLERAKDTLFARMLTGARKIRACFHKRDNEYQHSLLCNFPNRPNDGEDGYHCNCGIADVLSVLEEVEEKGSGL